MKGSIVSVSWQTRVTLLHFKADAEKAKIAALFQRWCHLKGRHKRLDVYATLQRSTELCDEAVERLERIERLEHEGWLPPLL